ncbi:putative MFS monocarboxylate transporter [Sclerotinia borealis F-4128]|uniref:Putative MFS monocarboxylate transporter n=1 Tax=Sclerotinia borealis (strain F-4128) TaxID=1432307 RepID=W9BZZ3_SCLBF|nr:putative MFS monocarboxylate transporter [Sclerotinia borealis F-4128]
MEKITGSGADECKVQVTVTVLEGIRDLEKGPTGSDNAEGSDIPRADGGIDAWLFLAACFDSTCTFNQDLNIQMPRRRRKAHNKPGFPFAFGVFQTYYSTHPPFDEHADSIAITGSCATGITLIAASFATQVWHLIVTQGVLYAIGGSLLYSPTMFYLDQWFVKRKGLALGVMWSGVGTSGLIFPFLLSYLVDKYGFRCTLRIWAVILLLLCCPLIYYIKPRIPATYPSEPPSNPSYTFLKSPIFWFLQAANILSSLGFFSPSIYLSSYSASLSFSPITGTALIALLNSFSVIGAISLGHLSDIRHITTVILLSSVLSALSVFLLWGISTSLPSLIFFTIIYGIFAGGWTAIWAGMIREVQRTDQKAGFGVLMGLFSAGRGVGSVACGPVTEWLVGLGGLDGVKGGYGTEYGMVIVFTGVSATCGLIGIGARFWKMERA